MHYFKYFLCVILLASHTTIPMILSDNQICMVEELPSENLDLHMPIAMMQAGLLFAHAASLTWLYKKNHLFGNTVLPSHIGRCETKLLLSLCASSSMMAAMYYLLHAMVFMPIITDESRPVSLFSTSFCNLFSAPLPDGMAAYGLVACLVQLCNLGYQDALESLNEQVAEMPIILTLKQKMDDISIANVQCPICYEQPQEAINPCKQRDHIYCKKCLEQCFNLKKNNFICELCRQPIQRVNDTFDILPPPSPKVTLRNWASGMNISFLLCATIFIELYGMLQCYL